MARLSVEQVDPAATLHLRRSVLRPHQSYDEIAAETDVAGVFAIAALVERIVVACALAHPQPLITMPEVPDGWRIRGMAADPAHRGEGLGTQVLDRVLDELRLHGAALVWCHARTPARTLYERAGFEQVGEGWVDPEIGPHVRMWKMLR